MSNKVAKRLRLIGEPMLASILDILDWCDIDSDKFYEWAKSRVQNMKTEKLLELNDIQYYIIHHEKNKTKGILKSYIYLTKYGQVTHEPYTISLDLFHLITFYGTCNQCILNEISLKTADKVENCMKKQGYFGIKIEDANETLTVYKGKKVILQVKNMIYHQIIEIPSMITYVDGRLKLKLEIWCATKSNDKNEFETVEIYLDSRSSAVKSMIEIHRGILEITKIGFTTTMDIINERVKQGKKCEEILQELRRLIDGCS